MERYVSYFGAPDELHIDQGQSVETELMSELGRLPQIQSTAYNLYTLLKMSSTICSDNPETWVELLPWMMPAYQFTAFS
ncbi:hypothetical protein T07_1245 [Trichinella nelsoni]|uniref:Uncharacterized protein n=1 Tax=Trichinella nelsoni TaxID=6336 RepID=A0A0V0S996_9BILA|nr:hypothetical protein T07_1245 [Trichinella nelsoni]